MCRTVSRAITTGSGVPGSFDATTAVDTTLPIRSPTPIAMTILP